MTLAQSLNNQRSVLRINIMVVDDDRVSLEIMSRMLERSKYGGKIIKYNMLLCSSYLH